MNFIENLLKNNSHVHVHNDKLAYVEQTIRSLISDGRKMLHVVADFDYTLTMYEKDAVILPSTFAVIESDDRVKLPDGSLLRVQADQLRSYYQSIEHDVCMNIDEKIPHMIEWWRKAQALLLLSNLNQPMIRALVYKSKLELKKGVKEFITELLRSETPILVFSAGLGDVIEIFLEKEIPEFALNHELSQIISNFIQYDTNGNLVAFSDTLGDVGMIAGMKNLKQILKIGFLNRSTPEKLEVYKSAYDIVVSDDQTFDIPNFILKAI
ncbi:unnamed protein product [Rotaria socialis]|uniref:5'-nucleotidase n=1 Tax=Rotaria socialis TaxID=392032 RepID=A0A818CPG3_9BILA|nr:unnamed protein product [Rotaria socialis]